MPPFVRVQLDYYAVLEIAPSADVIEVNAAFRRLAWRYHPDHNPAPGATLQFQDINEAHQVLSDPERRAEYDAKWHPELKFRRKPERAAGAPAHLPQFATTAPGSRGSDDPVCFRVRLQRVGGDLYRDDIGALLGLQPVTRRAELVGR